MYSQSLIMSQKSRKYSFGKVVFPIFGREFYIARWKLFFWLTFCNCISDFRFFAAFWFFWITLSVACISLPNSFGKVLFWHRDPPLTTNGSTLNLDHLSVKCRFLFPMLRFFFVFFNRKITSFKKNKHPSFFPLQNYNIGSNIFFSLQLKNISGFWDSEVWIQGNSTL